MGVACNTNNLCLSIRDYSVLRRKKFVLQNKECEPTVALCRTPLPVTIIRKSYKHFRRSLSSPASCFEQNTAINPKFRLRFTMVTGLHRSIAFAIVADLLRVRAEESVVHRAVGVLEVHRQSLRDSAVLDPGSKGVESGVRRAAGASVAVADAGGFEQAVVRVDTRDFGGEGVVVLQ